MVLIITTESCSRLLLAFLSCQLDKATSYVVSVTSPVWRVTFEFKFFLFVWFLLISYFSNFLRCYVLFVSRCLFFIILVE